MNDDAGTYYLLNDRLKPEDDFYREEASGGFSVYEIVRVKDSVAVFLEDHLHRLYHSLELENLGIKENEEAIRNQIRKLIRKNPVRSGKIRIVVNFYNYPQPRDYDLWFYFDRYEPPTKHQYQNGVATTLCRALRNDPNVKVLNTQARLKADDRIRESSVYEALLVDEEGYIYEGSRSNIFFITGSKLVTPPDEKVLQGIARSKILEICQAHHLDLQKRKVHQKELNEFGTAFLSGTTPKILPIRRIDNIYFSPENSLMAFLMQAYEDMVEKYINERQSYEMQ
ncbi:MAG: aminotransferase class IV [Bacteroidales bacterium]|nr:aminotransferase class IV [Bacteroidales bacterium]